MKRRNQTTYPIQHSSNNNNNSSNINTTNYNNNNNTNNSKNKPENVLYPSCIPTQNYCFNHTNNTNNNNNQRQQRNRCQILPPQQTLLPIQQYQHQQHQPQPQQQHQSPTLNNQSNNYQHRQLLPNTPTPTTTTTATMSSLTTSNFLPNQFTNFSNQQHFTPYLNQQQTYQQDQLTTYANTNQNTNRNQLPPHHQQQQIQQHALQQQSHQHHQQQQNLSQFQRRQQLHLPLFPPNAGGGSQQFPSNSQQQLQRRQFYEQQNTGNIINSSTIPNSNNQNIVGNSFSTNNGGLNNNDIEKFSLDANEIANFLAHELFMQQLVSVDGIQSGVPTLTTPTLTPTTLRSIEQTFMNLVEEPVGAPFQAGFIPPSYPSTSNNTTNNIGSVYNNGSIHDFNDSESDNSSQSLNQHINEDYQIGGDTTDISSATTDSTSYQNGFNGLGNKSSLGNSNSNSTSANDFSSPFAAVAAAAAAGKKGNNANTSSATTVTPPPTTRRNQGGRRPAKQSNLSPEEEEKRRIRRERNKLAAARCRKRRVDLTNELLEEVSQLEGKRDNLQKDIESLNTQKQELEYILEAHRPTCQKIRQDLLTVNTFGGLIVPNNVTTHSNDSNSNAITGIDTTLASTGRSSPIDLKPVLLQDNILTVQHIKNEPLDSALDSNSLDHDGPTSPKRLLLSSNNPMVPPPLPKNATLSSPLSAAASLNTPIVTSAPMSFGAFGSVQNNTIVVNTLNALNKPLLHVAAGGKQRPTTLPTMPRNPALGLNVDHKPPTDINGVAIQTPSTGMFNFDSLMDGGTGLTPVSGPLIPNCSSQNKHPLELTTPTSEPSKLVSL